MRQIIRESVRRMTVPKNKASTVPTDHVQLRLRHSDIEQTTTRHSAIESTLPHHARHSTLSADYYIDTAVNNPPTNYAPVPHRLTDNRYSMNLDCEKLTLPDLDTQGGRSRTYGDLLDLTDSTILNHCSKTSVSSESGSARLIYSSQDPIAYSSRSSLDNGTTTNVSAATTTPASPVWQRRSSSTSSDDNTNPSTAGAAAISNPVTNSHPFSATALSTTTGAAEGVVMRRSLKIHEVYMNTATEC